MPASDYSLLYIDGSLSEVNAAVDIAAARKARLYRSTFIDGDRAIRADAALLKTRGVDETIRILGNDAGIGHVWYFGMLRGGLLGPGNRKAALEALRELPDAIRDHYQLIMRQQDLLRARRETLERQERDFFEQRRHDRELGLENDMERDRDQGRTRK